MGSAIGLVLVFRVNNLYARVAERDCSGAVSSSSAAKPHRRSPPRSSLTAARLRRHTRLLSASDATSPPSLGS